MGLRAILLAVMTLLMPVMGTVLGAAELKSLTVVVVSDAPSPGRGEAFADWLRPLVAAVRVVHYRPTEIAAPATLAGDVVLLDWDPPEPAHAAARDAAGWAVLAAHATMPLGSRALWHTPTVLIGFAGVLAAESWGVAGGSGSPSLQPFAYAWRPDHPVLAGPLPVAVGSRIEISTPPAFRTELTSRSISVLPLVPGTPATQWPSGWCSDTDEVLAMPDVECISGGINDQAATAMAVWRQGDLLHVGFRQVPVEMDNTGRAMLANAIAYIADFHADRPIAILPSATGGHAPLPPRAALRLLLMRQSAGGVFTPSLLTLFSSSEQAILAPLVHDARGLERYCRERLPYLHPDRTSGGLTLDAQLQSRSVPYDSPAFLDLVLQALRSDPETGYVLLERYVPEFPKDHASIAQSAWVSTNRPYLFPSDMAGYRWSVDPLAKARGIPSASLRGPARRDQAAGASAVKP